MSKYTRMCMISAPRPTAACYLRDGVRGSAQQRAQDGRAISSRRHPDINLQAMEEQRLVEQHSTTEVGK